MSWDKKNSTEIPTIYYKFSSQNRVLNIIPNSPKANKPAILLISGYSRYWEKFLNSSKNIIPNGVNQLIFIYFHKIPNKEIIGYQLWNFKLNLISTNYETKQCIKYEPKPHLFGLSSEYHIHSIARNFEISSTQLNINKTNNVYNIAFLDREGVCIAFNDINAFQFWLPAINGQSKQIYSSKYGLLSFQSSGLYTFSFDKWQWNLYKCPNLLQPSILRKIIMMESENKVFSLSSVTVCQIYDLNNFNIFNVPRHGQLVDICYDDRWNKRVYAFSNHNACLFYDMILNSWYQLSVPINMKQNCDASIWIDQTNNNLLYLASWESNCIQMLDLRTNTRWRVVENDLHGICDMLLLDKYSFLKVYY